MESGTSDLEVGVPKSRGIFLLCGNIEHVESILGVSVDTLRVETSFRSVEFHHGGMVVRNPVLLVLKNQADVESVSWAPYTPFSVDKCLQALVQDFSSDIKTAQGLLVA